MTIERGEVLVVRTANGGKVTMRAMRAPERGRDFPVVWVCTEDSWDSGEEDGVPWPLDAVVEVQPA